MSAWEIRCGASLGTDERWVCSTGNSSVMTQAERNTIGAVIVINIININIIIFCTYI